MMDIRGFLLFALGGATVYLFGVPESEWSALQSFAPTSAAQLLLILTVGVALGWLSKPTRGSTAEISQIRNDIELLREEMHMLIEETTPHYPPATISQESGAIPEEAFEAATDEIQIRRPTATPAVQVGFISPIQPIEE